MWYVAIKKGEPKLSLGGELVAASPVVMDGGIGQAIVIAANRNCCPFFLSAGVVNVGQAATACKSMITNACHAIWNGDARQVGAAGECAFENAGYAIGDYDVRQAGATGECIVCNDFYTVSERHACQCGAMRKRIPTNR